MVTDSVPVNAPDWIRSRAVPVQVLSGACFLGGHCVRLPLAYSGRSEYPLRWFSATAWAAPLVNLFQSPGLVFSASVPVFRVRPIAGLGTLRGVYRRVEGAVVSPPCLPMYPIWPMRYPLPMSKTTHLPENELNYLLPVLPV